MAKDQLLPAGTTSYLLELKMFSSTSGLGKTGLASGDVTCRYIRRGAGGNIALPLQAATLGSWLSGGWVEVDPSDQRGLYQFGVPDAAIASGADAVTFTFQAAGSLDARVELILDQRVSSREAEADAAARAAADIAEHDETQAMIAALGSAPTAEEVATAVWAFSTRTLTQALSSGGGGSGLGLYLSDRQRAELLAAISEAVWKWRERTLTAFDFPVAIKGERQNLDGLEIPSPAEIRAAARLALEDQGVDEGRLGRLDRLDAPISEIRAAVAEGALRLDASRAEEAAGLERLRSHVDRAIDGLLRDAASGAEKIRLQIDGLGPFVAPAETRAVVAELLESRGVTSERLERLDAPVSSARGDGQEGLADLLREEQGATRKLLRDLREQMYRWLFLGSR